MNSATRARTTSDILLGIVLVLAGVAMAVYSASAVRVSLVIIAWLLIGLGVAVGALAYLRRTEPGWWIRLAGGVVLIILGVLALTNPGTTQFTLSIVAGAYFIASGALRLMASYPAPDARLILAVGGVASIVMGALLLSRLGDRSWQSFLGLLIGIELAIEGLTLALTGTDPALRRSVRGFVGRIVDDEIAPLTSTSPRTGRRFRRQGGQGADSSPLGE
ncbi:MAG TPA: hypothetical protein GX743_03250 [Actinomycetales bacterium]|nr:hypothetical protein [Actinomycetales bacterium]